MDSYTSTQCTGYHQEAENYNDLTIVIPESFEIYSGQYRAYTQPCRDVGQSPLLLHAPIPLPGQTLPLLGCSVLNPAQFFHQPPNPPAQFFDQLGQPTSLEPCEPEPFVVNPQYCVAPADMQPTFPTPSELLAELAEKGLPVTGDDSFGSDSVPSESASKARRRAMAKRIGFVPTDPDTISSHEKKRHYLECLEQYILYIHKQFELLGARPVPLERVTSYRGLNSRSIRTMLVHMENTARRLNLRTVAEEQRFVSLREEVLQRVDHTAQS